MTITLDISGGRHHWLSKEGKRPLPEDIVARRKQRRDDHAAAMRAKLAEAKAKGKGKAKRKKP